MEEIKTSLVKTPELVKTDFNREHLLESGFSVNRIYKEDSDLWLKMGKLRAQVYVHDRKFLSPDVLDENGAEYDEDDNNSDHFVAVSDENDVIGTVRVVHRGEDNKLPCEKLFEINFSPGDSVEVSRIMVDSNVPMRLKSLVSVSLLRAAIKVAPEKEENAYAIVESSMYRYLNDLIGIKCQTIIKSQFVEEYNSNNSLVLLQPHRMISQIHDRDNHKRALKGLPEKLAPFFEENASKACLGRVALNAINKPNLEQFDRNLGFISEVEHRRLQDSTVAIAGAGGDGGELAITLAQLGVGRFRIADPERFEINNLNRQAGANYNTIGRNKADVIAEMILDINPHADVQVFTDGVTPDNVDEFIEGSNLVIDETEFTHHELGVMIARKARKNKLPVLMTLNVGFGAYTTSFSPDSKTTFESYLGLDPKASLEEIAKKTVPLSRWVPHIPSYADINNFKKVAAQEVPTPSVSIGVKIAVAEASTQALAHLLKEISPQRANWIIYAPGGKSVDMIDGVNRIRNPQLHYIFSLGRAALRTILGKNPPAGY